MMGSYFKVQFSSEVKTILFETWNILASAKARYSFHQLLGEISSSVLLLRVAGWMVGLSGLLHAARESKYD